MPNPTVLTVAYTGNECARSKEDWFWCEKHDSQIGDAADGWFGCTKAEVADLRAIADAYEAAQAAANALVETNYPAYERASVDLVVPGVRISNFLLRFAEPEDA